MKIVIEQAGLELEVDSSQPAVPVYRTGLMGAVGNYSNKGFFGNVRYLLRLGAEPQNSQLSKHKALETL